MAKKHRITSSPFTNTPKMFAKGMLNAISFWLSTNLYFDVSFGYTMMWEITGYLGGGLIAMALLPQIIKTWKTKSVEDISLLWTIVLMIGLLFYVVYAIKNTIIPLLIFASVEAVMTLILIIFKLVYSKANN